MSEWIYRNGEPVKGPPEWAVGMVYAIYNDQAIDEETGKYYAKVYIGKKALIHTNRKKIGVREKAATKTRKTYKKVTKDSGWREYWGSCEELHKDRAILGDSAFERIVLEWCHSKKHMGYIEVKHQILNEVLETSSYNGNISGKWYRRDLERPSQDK